MKSFKAFLFDLDGVLVDTAKYHFLAWKRLANELGFDFTEEQNERLKGVSRMRSLEILLEIGNIEVGVEKKEELASKKNEWYVEYISTMDPSQILPGVKEFLQELKNAGKKTALGSASKNAMTIVTNTGLLPYFDAVIDGTKVTKAKPDPEVFLLGAKELDVEPKECVVFEDAEAGIEAAKRAGMYAVGIGSYQRLSKADLVIPSLNGFTLLDLEKKL
ncbi:Beta-phosphoglucomutase [[Clostridium] ultunense Esp]|uniref:beta-phosphoglucomutase n=1 Tax=Thermicanus aegyptius TaxID=94009 RepID=UPI0002B6FF55|nr:beta-phosphoglucomutase [Thermicanus aegyptius]CCQ96377.1 Beta-phosphoglucomutase [[Clostridium] ultunense Esp]